MIPVFTFDRSEEVVPGFAVAVHRAEFTKAIAAEDVHTFGGKDLVLVDDRAQFAEVAILRAFEAEGWEGRWLETYGKPAMKPALWREWKLEGPAAQEHVSIEVPWVIERLHAIAVANGNTYAGCWDVVAWKEGRLVFAESKKQKKDRLRGTQLRWLEAALTCGMTVEDFLMVEWRLR
ncbi:MAG: hypothetical protein IPJ76_00070 [Flavobacteriales bacterium]|nr:MAG: hypothetical protein IPJ76_00070 [Flavobacteriales bacterium]